MQSVPYLQVEILNILRHTSKQLMDVQILNAFMPSEEIIVRFVKVLL